MTIWAAISWYSAGPIDTLSGQITASDYVDILGTQLHPMVQTLFPNNNAVFQEDIHSYTQLQVFSLGFSSRCASASSLVSTIARHKYHQTTLVSFRDKSEKQISSSINRQATIRI